ncbi:MAG TPA: hypothetical protein VFZ34_22060, partial [Blastocatellia bacterium]|nr:hypothetical protein [Blastocatellia bacterium]
KMTRHWNRSKFLFILALFLCFALPASSHDPITTSVTFNKEIIRILQRSCLDCHAPGKIKADIPLTSYEEARPWAKAIKEEVLEKRMPPFQAVKGYGEFHNPYLLSQREIELLISWVEGGAPRGEVKDLPKEIVPSATWSFGKPQLNLQPEQIIKIPAGEGEYTACVKLPTNLKQAQWAHAIEFLPTNAAAVLGAEFFLQKQCGTNCAVGEKIGEWVPGQDAIQFPEGAGLLLPANSCLTMKIRYKQGEQEAQDHSILGVYFAFEDVALQTQRVVIKPAPTIVAAGAKPRVKASYIVRENAEALAIRPLMFPLATSVEATAIRPDGSVEVLILAQAYRYNWQPSYFFKQPVKLPAGTRVEVTAYLDNSDNNRNLQDDPKAKKFAEPLVELTLAKPKLNATTNKSNPNSSVAQKH